MNTFRDSELHIEIGKNDLPIRELTPFDKEFPDRLRYIPNPPKVLYLRGALPPDDMPTVAIIGARACTDYGRNAARSFGRILSKNGVAIISGLAYGIDSEGQAGAVDAAGKTYAVIGSGVNICYPAKNFPIYEKLLSLGGGVISEYPENYPPLRENFVQRNRLISGLSDIVLVIEAREKSGTGITVSYALDQGKQVFALPGRITDQLSAGCNRLIRDGAEILTSPEDVLAALHLKHAGECTIQEKDTSSLSSKQKRVYEALTDDAEHLDFLLDKTKLSVTELTAILLELEILGFSECTKTGFYRRKAFSE